MSRKITRRDFLKLSTAGIATSVLAGCQNPRRWVVLEPYVKPPEEQLAGIATWYASTCRQCPAGCGIIVRVMNGRALKIEGNPQHPLNQGKLCGRGQAGLQVLYNPDRLPGPVMQEQRGTRQFSNISWNEGINQLFTKIQSAGGKVGVWLGSTTSSHLYDLFQRFTNAIGAPAPLVYDLFTGIQGQRALQENSSALFASSELPIFDISRADLILSFGANFLGPSLSQVRYGIEFGKFRSQALGKRGYLVQLESRKSITGAKSDQWIPIRPGSEALVAQAIARIIADQGLGPADRIERAKKLAGNADLREAVLASDISYGNLVRLANMFANADRPLAIPGDSLSGQDNASDAIGSVQMLNIIAGVYGQPGGPSLSPESPLSSLIKTNPSSFKDVKATVDQMNSGDIQVLLVHSANPFYELPKQVGFSEALKKVPFVVSFNPIVDETAVWADLVLPEHTYLEGWGYTVVSPGFDMPVIGSQQPVVTPFHDTRSTGDLLLTVAKGIPAAAKALPWDDEVAFLKNTITQLPPGAAGGIGTEVLWSRFQQHGGWWPGSTLPASVTQPKISTPIQISSPKYQGDPQAYPYFLNLYISDLLSDGRGANQPWLQGSPDPMTTGSWQTLVEIHPSTAQSLGLQDADIVKVTSPNGEIECLVYTFQAIRPDTVAVAFGQGHTDYGRYARNRGANPIDLVGATIDHSGNSLTWANLRVKITTTGKKGKLAIFENKFGVTEGFINQAFPGQ
jgi:anaerobic selenocysteine-containing dehydrogenase